MQYRNVRTGAAADVYGWNVDDGVCVALGVCLLPVLPVAQGYRQDARACPFRKPEGVDFGLQGLDHDFVAVRCLHDDVHLLHVLQFAIEMEGNHRVVGRNPV